MLLQSPVRGSRWYPCQAPTRLP